MNELSNITKKPAPPRAVVHYSVLILVLLLCAWIPAGAFGQSGATLAQSKPRQKATAVYSCPMHPEVKSHKRGKCPKCKMELRELRDDSAPAAQTRTPLDSTGGNPVVDGHDDVTRSTRTMTIPDVEVLDQHGNALHFYTDLIKDKTIAINFIFTNCTTICPPLAATFARVQKQLGDKVGRDVHFISISVDPVTDTPERLKAWGAKFKAGAGWTFVTGNKDEMDKLLSALGASVSRREDHSPAVIIGNDQKGLWTRTYGLASPSVIAKLILDVLEGKIDESQTKDRSK